MKYVLTSALRANIKKINLLVQELNRRRFAKVVLMAMARVAREVSAHASTQIEGNPLPLTAVKQLLKSQPANLNHSQQEVVNYNQALENLDQLLKEKTLSFNLCFVLQVHHWVTRTLLPKFQSGHWRQEPVFVNDPRLGQTIYWPPDHQDVPALMKDLITFVCQNQGQVDPLILAGLFHKHFVLIHPFIDGNGRTARLLTKALLAKMGLGTFNLFSFENYYNQNVTTYFHFVGERGSYYDLVKKLDFTDWLIYFTNGIIDELERVKKLLAAESVT